MSASTDPGCTEAEVVLAVRGEIDIATSPLLWDEISRSVSVQTKRLVLDLSEVSFIDASGVSVIERTWSCLGDDAQIVLRRPNRLAHLVFEIVNLERLCQIETGGADGNGLNGDASAAARIIDLTPLPERIPSEGHRQREGDGP